MSIGTSALAAISILFPVNSVAPGSALVSSPSFLYFFPFSSSLSYDRSCGFDVCFC